MRLGLVHRAQVELIVRAIYKVGTVGRESHEVMTHAGQRVARRQRKREPYDRSWRGIGTRRLPNRDAGDEAESQRASDGARASPNVGLNGDILRTGAGLERSIERKPHVADGLKPFCHVFPQAKA